MQELARQAMARAKTGPAMAVNFQFILFSIKAFTFVINDKGYRLQM